MADASRSSFPSAVGALRSGLLAMACAAAFLGAPSISAAQSLDASAPAPTVSVARKAALGTPAQAAASEFAALSGMKPSFDARVGPALQTSLNASSHLPESIVFAFKADSKGAGSASLYNRATGSCQIGIAFDSKGRSTLQQELAATFRSISPSIQASFLEMEVLHEAAHCLSAAHGLSFDLPGLSEKDSKTLSAALEGSAMGAIWSESKSDAFAALSLLSRASDPQAFDQAVAAIEALRAWRMQERQSQADPFALKKTSHISDHVTETTLDVILSDPHGWVRDPASLESKANRAASQGLVALFPSFLDPMTQATEAFDAQARSTRAFRLLTPMLFNAVERAALSASLLNDPQEIAQARSRFAQSAASTFARVDPYQLDAYSRALASDPSFASDSFDLMLSSLKKGSPLGEMALSDALIAQWKSRGTFQALTKKAGPADLGAEAFQAWSRAMELSPLHPGLAERPDAQAQLDIAQRQLDQASLPEPGSLNLTAFRSRREPSPSHNFDYKDLGHMKPASF